MDHQFCLPELVGYILYSAEDITQLQYFGDHIGIQVELTPKYQGEIAGGAVDYSCELEKGWYL